jgi:putative DNA primase/helicase
LKFNMDKKPLDFDRALKDARDRSQDNTIPFPEKIVRPPKFADDAIALRFSDRQFNRLRYVAALGKWLIWDGRRWIFDDTLLARHRAREVCREVAAECSDPKVAKLIASAKTISAVERLAQADRRMATTVDELDAVPLILNTRKGVIDLTSGDLYPHRPSDRLTKITRVAPDDSRPTPQWDAFLKRITGDNSELTPYLARVAGYSLTGLTREHAMFFCYGLGANGKTTFINVISDCAGDYHRTAPIQTFTVSSTFQHPTDLAGLRGARLVTAVETEEGRRWAESKIKSLTGGDKISARFMRQDFFEYTPQFKLIIAGNHKPSLRSVDDAMRRRVNVIPFEVTIPAEERDEKLPEKLKREYPGILAWMIRGCIDWLAQGLAPPKIVTDATAAYMEAEDAMAAWIEEAGDRDPNAWENSNALFASWSAWATKAGEYVGSQKRFLGLLEAKGLEFHRKEHGRGFRGLRLKVQYGQWNDGR